jgi:hypothetical protein
MSTAGLDAAQLGRSLAQVADGEADHVDLFLERLERHELPDEESGPGAISCRETGLAVRLLRSGRTWLSARDRVGPEELAGALRQVARAVPNAAYLPDVALPEPWLEEYSGSELIAFPRRVREGIRREGVAFPTRMQMARHRRWVQVVGTRLIPAAQTEDFYSLVVAMPWGSYGALLADLGDEAVATVEKILVQWFEAREAPPFAEARRERVVLGPAATAVFLHEAVAHALEADTLALVGPVEAACGVRLARESVDVLDDPTSAPVALRRDSDDEGMPTIRRWLLKSGEVREPLADLVHAESSVLLSPGAGRRGSRHLAPVPRSYHLELLPGGAGSEDLLAAAEGGLFLPVASRGTLDPLSGEVEMAFPFGRRIGADRGGELVGPCRLRGTVAELLSSIDTVAAETRFGGAGWCGKGGHRLPVWATCPALLLEDVEVLG